MFAVTVANLKGERARGQAVGAGNSVTDAFAF